MGVGGVGGDGGMPAGRGGDERWVLGVDMVEGGDSQGVTECGYVGGGTVV